MKNLLFIVGSTRKNSFNLQLAKKAESYILKNKSNVRIEYLNFFDVPFFNQDSEFPAPKQVSLVREKIENSSGIWIFTPEYNQSYPGILKNLLDWLSRPIKQFDFGGETSAQGKKVTISGISGKSATKGSREKLSQLLKYIEMNLCCDIGEGFSLDRVAFQTDTLNLSNEDIIRLQNQAEKFLSFLNEDK